MDETLTKLVWIGVGVGIIIAVYLVLQKFVPDFTRHLTGKLREFVDRTFKQAMDTEKNTGGGTK